MDEVWQQNKKWILGTGAGLLLFWIATSIVTSIYDGGAAEAKARKAARMSGEFYDQKALRTARQDGDELERMQEALRTELEAEFDDRFDLAGKGDPDLHFDQMARAVRERLVDTAQASAVELSAEDLEWQSPVGREEIQRTLRGLGVLEQAASRLLEAGEEVREADPDAVGLLRIEKFEVERKSRGNRSKPRRRRGGRGRRAGRNSKKPQVDIESRIVNDEVSFKFRADAATLQLFLEKCRSKAPVLLIQDGFHFKVGRDRGDAATITGRVVGLSVQDAE